MPSDSALGPQPSALSAQYSMSPSGEQFPLPTPQDEAAELDRLQKLVAEHRAQGQEIVVVLGVGFVGAVMAGIIADSVVKGGHDEVIGGHDPNSQNSGSCPPISGLASCPEPLLAHSYERVMPGRNYVSSIRDFWRVCSGINDASRERVRKFISEVLNVEKFPLTVLDRPIESETCKIVENSYRATILAFLNEWSLFAERNGVDLIKVRRRHELTIAKYVLEKWCNSILHGMNHAVFGYRPFLYQTL